MLGNIGSNDVGPTEDSQNRNDIPLAFADPFALRGNYSDEVQGRGRRMKMAQMEAVEERGMKKERRKMGREGMKMEYKMGKM